MTKVFRHMTVTVIALMILSIGCNKITSPSYDEDRINNILYDMKQAFNNHDIDAFMQYFHYDYLHEGQNRWLMRQIWLGRMGEYLLLDFQDVEIEVYNDEAIVYFTLKLQNQTETVYTDEPAASGDLSYFRYVSYDWYLYGNQLYK